MGSGSAEGGAALCKEQVESERAEGAGLGTRHRGCSSSQTLQDPALTLSKKVKLKRENPDLLELCHSLPMEVFHLGETPAGEAAWDSASPGVGRGDLYWGGDV